MSQLQIPPASIYNYSDSMEYLRKAWATVKRPLRIISGIILVTLGIAGLLLPIMPGWILLIPGIALLAGRKSAKWARRKLHELRERLFSGPGE